MDVFLQYILNSSSHNIMQKYQMIKKLGSGTFGNVEKAQNIQTKEMVAIKQLKKKYGTWEQCLQLSEVKALRKLSHPNIIKLKEVIRVVNDAFFVFEYIEKDLFKLITQRKEKGQRLADDEISHFTKQITSALSCIHKHGFFHRDIKPENILISYQNQIKIIDFGIAKEIRSQPPFTDYISTRWYRAPELLFKFSTYSTPVDIFALGCLVAEMYLMRPLFQGNSEMDQISKICSVMGSPSNQSWPEGYKHATKKGINFPQYKQLSLSNVIADCPADALSFINECLKWDPLKRMNANQLLNHSFLNREVKKVVKIVENPYLKRQKNYSFESGKKKNELKVNRDDEFDQLLDNFAETKIKSAKNVKEEEDDDW